MDLVQKQQKFAQLVSRLLRQADVFGYQVTLGEAHRPQFVAEKYAEEGVGIKHSLHCIRLAIDLNLFKDGKFLNKNEQYRELGIWWELQSTMDIKCVWGGRFGDGNHFSVEHQGVK